MAHRKTKQHTVNVVMANFSAPDNLSYLDLFEGYDELYAVNFVSNLDFLTEIIPFFTKAEIIFGNPAIVPTRLDTTFAMQKETLCELYKSEQYKQLAQRINDDSLKIFLADAPLYPEKLFCMKNGEGSTRVIIGSSNLDQLPSNCDRNASIICFDDEAAYTYYINLFEQFKNEHSYILDKTAAQITFEDKQILENLPILHKAQANSEHIYHSVPKSTIVKMTEYIADIERLAKDFVELPKPDRKGQSQITPDKINSIKTKTLDNMAAGNEANLQDVLQTLIPNPTYSVEDGVDVESVHAEFVHDGAETPAHGGKCLRATALLLRFAVAGIEHIRNFRIPGIALSGGGHHHIFAGGVGVHDGADALYVVAVRQRRTAEFADSKAHFFISLPSM